MGPKDGDFYIKDRLETKERELTQVEREEGEKFKTPEYFELIRDVYIN